ncbi:MAG: glycosyltransferase family 39 protein [Vicinamibacterales bacterium]
MRDHSIPRLAIGTLATIAIGKLLLHVAAMREYGYFRDELYYLASTNHLDWGYVEHPPLSIAVLALVRAALGDSLPALRVVPALIGVATVCLAAVITRQLGGGRFAQALAAVSVAMSPVFLATAHYYSMNVFDQLFWSLAVLVLLRAMDEGRPFDWVVLGAVLGLGFLNKVSILWLGAGMFIGLVATPYRRVLHGRWPWMAAFIAVVLALPYLLWQVSNDWPTLEFIRNATTVKMVDVSPLRFLLDQILSMNPGAAPVWLAGITLGAFGAQRERGRVVVWIYLTVFAVLVLAGRSRSSYLAPAYPPLFALGAVVLERVSAPAAWRWLRPSLIVPIVVIGIIALPMALPVLPVDTFVRYQAALGLSPRSEERQRMGALPQQYADMFGWEDMTALVAEAYHRLTPEERQRCRVFGQNYGEAGAIDVLGRRFGLPRALSGHNSYWLWGPDAGSWDVLIIVGGDSEDHARFFHEIEIVGQTRSQWSMPYERGLNVSIARHPKMDVRQLWPMLKQYI